MPKYQDEIMKRFLENCPIKGRIKREFVLAPKASKDDVVARCNRIKSKRADLVIECKDEMWFLEVKRKLNATSLGQVLSYKFLAEKYGLTTKKIRLGVVVENLDEELTNLFDQFQVKVFAVSQSRKAS